MSNQQIHVIRGLDGKQIKAKASTAIEIYLQLHKFGQSNDDIDQSLVVVVDSAGNIVTGELKESGPYYVISLEEAGKRNLQSELLTSVHHLAHQLFLLVEVKLGAIKQISESLALYPSASDILASPHLRDTFSYLIKKTINSFKGPNEAGDSYFVVMDTLQCPLKIDDDSLIVIVHDDTDEEFSLAYLRVGGELFCILMDNFKRPWGSAVVTNRDSVLRERFALSETLYGPEFTPQVLCDIIKHYSDNVGKQMIVAMVYGKLGLQSTYMSLRRENDSIVLENDARSFTISLIGNELHVLDNNTENTTFTINSF